MDSEIPTPHCSDDAPDDFLEFTNSRAALRRKIAAATNGGDDIIASLVKTMHEKPGTTGLAATNKLFEGLWGGYTLEKPSDPLGSKSDKDIMMMLGQLAANRPVEPKKKRGRPPKIRIPEPTIPAPKQITEDDDDI
jgi:hypothetical protein